MRRKTGELWKWTKGWCEGASPIFGICLFCGLNEVTQIMLGLLSHHWQGESLQEMMHKTYLPLKTWFQISQACFLREHQWHWSGTFPSHKSTVASSRPSGADRVTHAIYVRAKGSPTHRKGQGLPWGNMYLKNALFLFKKWMRVFTQMYIKVTHAHLRNFRSSMRKRMVTWKPSAGQDLGLEGACTDIVGNKLLQFKLPCGRLTEETTTLGRKCR